MKRALFLAALFVASCTKAPKQNASDLNWGHTSANAAYMQGWLVNVGPKEEVELCGAGGQAVAQAIQTWAGVLGRSLKIVACGKGTNVKTRVQLNLNSQADACNAGAAGFASAGPEASLDICGNAQVPTAYVILHEVGHLWGLCDQYPGGTGLCHSTHSTEPDNNSVMGNGNTMQTAPSADDAAGLIALTKRPEFKATTAAWNGGATLWDEVEESPDLSRTLASGYAGQNVCELVFQGGSSQTPSTSSSGNQCYGYVKYSGGTYSEPLSPSMVRNFYDRARAAGHAHENILFSPSCFENGSTSGSASGAGTSSGTSTSVSDVCYAMATRNGKTYYEQIDPAYWEDFVIRARNAGYLDSEISFSEGCY